MLEVILFLDKDLKQLKETVEAQEISQDDRLEVASNQDLPNSRNLV